MDICRRKFGVSLLGGLAASRLHAAARPKLLVLVVLEQCRPDYLESLASQLSAGGFKKLFEKGAWFPDCRHLASGFSATGIATLATGAWPAQHGIVADSWFDRSTKLRIRPSDESLLSTTLMFEMASALNVRISVVSMNAAHGRIFAGTPTAAIYWMDDQGKFQTNGAAPDWLEPFNQRMSPEAQHDANWPVLGVRADAPPLRTLTFDAKHPEHFMALYKASPFAQEAQFGLVNELVSNDHLGQGDTLDVLCVLSSSMNLLGYETGAHSGLMDQMVLQLDRRLEALLGQLSHAPGDGGFNLVVTAAHGAPYDPDSARARMAVDGETVARHIDAALSSHAMGHVEKFLYPFLYLDGTGFRDPEEIRKAAGRAALDHPAVADYYTAGGASSAQNQWLQRFRNSFHPKRSGDVMLSYRPGYVEDFLQGRGISYGSLYNYDARVPLLLYGPQFRAGVFDQNVETVDVAPTLAHITGAPMPSSSTGRVLSEALT